MSVVHVIFILSMEMFCRKVGITVIPRVFCYAGCLERHLIVEGCMVSWMYLLHHYAYLRHWTQMDIHLWNDWQLRPQLLQQLQWATGWVQVIGRLAHTQLHKKVMGHYIDYGDMPLVESSCWCHEVVLHLWKIIVLSSNSKSAEFSIITR